MIYTIQQIFLHAKIKSGRKRLLTLTARGLISAEEQEKITVYLDRIEKVQLCSAKTPIPQCRLVVFDTEASFTDEKSPAQLLSIGATAIHNGYIPLSETFEVYIQIDADKKVGQASIHGILSSDLAGENNSDSVKDRRNALLEFLAFIDNSILIAHHASFDLALINAELKKLFGIRIYNPTIDSAWIARRAEEGFLETHSTQKYSLDALFERYREKFPLDSRLRHTALGDAMLTAELLLIFFTALAKRGVKTIGDLLKTRPFSS